MRWKSRVRSYRLHNFLCAGIMGMDLALAWNAFEATPTRWAQGLLWSFFFLWMIKIIHSNYKTIAEIHHNVESGETREFILTRTEGKKPYEVGLFLGDIPSGFLTKPIKRFKTQEKAKKFLSFLDRYATSYGFKVSTRVMEEVFYTVKPEEISSHEV